MKNIEVKFKTKMSDYNEYGFIGGPSIFEKSDLIGLVEAQKEISEEFVFTGKASIKFNKQICRWEDVSAVSICNLPYKKFFKNYKNKRKIIICFYSGNLLLTEVELIFTGVNKNFCLKEV